MVGRILEDLQDLLDRVLCLLPLIFLLPLVVVSLTMG